MYKKCYGLPAPAAAAKRLPLGALGTNTAEEPSPPAVRSDAQPAVQQAAQVAHSWLRSRAEKEIGVDWKNGLYIGDKISDLKAAVKAKAKPVLVKTGYGNETLEKLNTFANKDLKKQTEVYENLLEFAESLTALTG